MAAGRSNPKHTRRRKQRGPSAATVISLLVCVVCFGAAFLLWNAALSGVDRNETGESFRPVVGDPPYRVCVDAGHGGSDPGARGVVEEKEMTARTSEALLALEAKQLVESTYTEVRGERSFTLLEDVNCPAVLAEQCFVTSEEDVARFGSEDGCKAVARIYYESICAYFGTQPLDTPQS